MNYLKFIILCAPIICVLLVFPAFPQNSIKPSITIQRFEAQNGVEVSSSTLNLLMENLYDALKRIKKFSEIKIAEPPPPIQTSNTPTPANNITPETDYLMTGIITNHTKPGLFTKITTAGLLNKTIIYLTFTVIERKSGKIVVKRNINGTIGRSPLFDTALEPAYKIAKILDKGL